VASGITIWCPIASLCDAATSTTSDTISLASSTTGIRLYVHVCVLEMNELANCSPCKCELICMQMRMWIVLYVNVDVCVDIFG
jgi:hypothetical protein